MDRYALLRAEMVSSQIESRGITDPCVLSAMREIPRHRFVPADIVADAYFDRPVPIGRGQTISQPYIVAFMTQALELAGTERVLEIGTGSGYQAAVLSRCAAKVYTMEVRESLYESATALLAELGYGNIVPVHGDGNAGYPAEAPYDRIIITAAAPSIPGPLLEQLADSGLLIAPVGPIHGSQELTVVRRRGRRRITESILPVRFVPLVGGDRSDHQSDSETGSTGS